MDRAMHLGDLWAQARAVHPDDPTRQNAAFIGALGVFEELVTADARAARIAAQTENEALKARLAASGVAERRAVREAVLAEREACVALMAELRARSRNHLFRSALTVAEGEIRARGAA